jgi:hypothetical protein
MPLPGAALGMMGGGPHQMVCGTLAGRHGIAATGG